MLSQQVPGQRSMSMATAVSRLGGPVLRTAEVLLVQTSRSRRSVNTTASVAVYQCARVGLKKYGVAKVRCHPQCPNKTFSNMHYKGSLCTPRRLLSTRQLDDVSFHKLSSETLEELTEFFEDLGDSGLCASDFDVALADGVLTVHMGSDHGTYVINKQSPNRQIWFSSPTSGPKRFDIIDGRWRYSHDGVALHDLLQEEFSRMLGTELDLSQLGHFYIISDEGNWAT